MLVKDDLCRLNDEDPFQKKLHKRRMRRVVYGGINSGQRSGLQIDLLPIEMRAPLTLAPLIMFSSNVIFSVKQQKAMATRVK